MFSLMMRWPSSSICLRAFQHRAADVVADVGQLGRFQDRFHVKFLLELSKRSAMPEFSTGWNSPGVKISNKAAKGAILPAQPAHSKCHGESHGEN